MFIAKCFISICRYAHMSPTSANQREQRGQFIVATPKGTIKRYNASRYLVKSQSSNRRYKVILTR